MIGIDDWNSLGFAIAKILNNQFRQEETFCLALASGKGSLCVSVILPSPGGLASVSSVSVVPPLTAPQLFHFYFKDDCIYCHRFHKTYV